MTELDCKGIGMTSERTRARLLARLRERGIVHEPILETMQTVPRHLFVDEALAQRAYEDIALPIGFGQTLSQPYVVARMTAALLQQDIPCKNVLEIGTGSGYQTAILAQLAEKVVSIERVEPLLQKAKGLLRKLSCRNVQFIHGNGYHGYGKAAPYDAILVTAAAQVVPQALQHQLADGGRLVIPVGLPDTKQELQLITRHGNTFNAFTLDMVRFVPLIDDEL